jgi:hypothetical protein
MKFTMRKDPMRFPQWGGLPMPLMSIDRRGRSHELSSAAAAPHT